MQDLKTRLSAVDMSALKRFAENVATGIKWLGRKPRARGHHIISYGETSLPVTAALAACALIVFALYLDVRTWSAALVWAIDGSAIRLARKLPNWIVIVFNALTDFGKSGWLDRKSTRLN